MRKVFISYSSKDRDVARALAAALEGAWVDGQPLSVWWDRALVAGDDYWRVIAHHLEAADAAIVLWSDTALLSDWVYAEACRAKNARKVVPVAIVGRIGERPPMPFDVLHTVKLADAVAALPEILDGISARIARKPWRTAPGRNARELDVEVLESKRDPMPVAAYLGPGDLLKAKNQHEVIWFDDVHGLAEDFVAWARRPASAAQGRSALGRLVHAPGGFGKTRLMIEVVDRLQREGWLAGFVPRGLVGSPRQAVLERLIDGGEDAAGLLLVVDYVEQRTAETAWLAERLDQRSGPERRPARLVMLARGAGDTWWPDWLDKTSTLQRLLDAGGPTIPGKGRPYDVIRVPDDLRASDRAAMFDAAYQAFVQHRPPDREPAPYSERLERLIETDARYDRPLALQMAALLTAWGYDPAAGGSDISDLLSKIVGLEREHWDRVSRLGDGDRNAREALGRAVALGTLAQGIGGREVALDLLARDARLAQMKDIDAPRLHDMAAKLYPREDGGIGALEPDLLGEHLVAQVLDDALCDLALDAAGEDGEARRNVLTVLNRATRAEHGATGDRAARQLERVISQRGETLAVDLMRVGTSTPGRLLELLPRLREVLPLLSRERLAELSDALPEQSLALMEFSLEVTRVLVKLLEQVVLGEHGNDADELKNSDAKASAQLAISLMDFGVRLGESGRHDEAIATSKRAVSLFRDLAVGDHNLFVPMLARCLNNLGLHLGAIGRRPEALTVTEEAVEHYRRLSAVSKKFVPNLARMLSNLGKHLGESARSADALAVSDEAVSLYRQLAVGAPAVYSSDLARALTNLGLHLGEAGRRFDALIASTEAADIYRQLASVAPDAFTADLARGLSNLGKHLGESGRVTDAISATEEAVGIFRRLAAVAPDAFAPEFARSLLNLGAHLSHVGLWAEAIPVTEEAVNLSRQLAIVAPEAFNSYLAWSTGNLGLYLGLTGRAVESIAFSEESVAIFRWMARAEPHAFTSELARALTNFGIALESSGRLVEAKEAIVESVGMYRRLAVVSPDITHPQLARSLSVLSDVFALLDRTQEAAETAHEALQFLLPSLEAVPLAWAGLALEIMNDLKSYCAAAGQVVDAELVARAMRALSSLDTASSVDHADSGTAAT